MGDDASPSAGRPRNRIVIVDDDHTIRFILRRELLKRKAVSARWDVKTAATPSDGFGFARTSAAGQPLVVIADYDLRAPTNGAELLEEVRSARPDAVLVLMSGRPREALEGEIARVRPRAYIEKPDDLADIVTHVLPLLVEAGGAAPSSAAEDDDGESEDASTVAPVGVPDVYRALVDSMSEQGVMLVDPDGYVRTWSRGAERLHGYSEDEVTGEYLGLLYAPTDAANHKPRFDLRVAAQDGRLDETAWLSRKDGSMFWASVIITALRDETGALNGYSFVVRDLTDRWHHEEALRQSEERHRRMVESVKDYAIFQLDATGRVTSWNEGAERIKGYSPDDIIGHHFSKFYTPEDRANGKPTRGLKTAVDEGRFLDEGWRMRKDGTRFWASVVITPLYGSDGQLRGFAKVTRDLTERKLHEEALRQRASQLGMLTRELETFNYTVAHDLRSPLRAVTHLSDVLLNEEDVSEEEEREILGTIHSSAVRMGQLVEDLFALSRVTAGDVERERVDVTSLAQEVCEQVKARMRESDAEIRIQSGLVAHADPRMLRVAFENLVSNALKFSAGTPHPVVEIGRTGPPDAPVFHVKDNGIGFDDSRAEGLFQPFRRLHSAKDFEGSGIGLATVARIVERHGGRVWAEAAPGEGATFHFTLGDEDGDDVHAERAATLLGSEPSKS